MWRLFGFLGAGWLFGYGVYLGYNYIMDRYAEDHED